MASLVDELKYLVDAHVGLFTSFTDHETFTVEKFSDMPQYRQIDLLGTYKLSIKTWRDEFLSNILKYDDQINKYILGLVSYTNRNDAVQGTFIKYIFVKYIQQCDFAKMNGDLNKNTQKTYYQSRILTKLISDLLIQIQSIMSVQNNKCPKFVEIDTNIKNIISEIKTNFGHMSHTYQEITMEEADMIDSGNLTSDDTYGITKTDSVNSILDNITDLILIWYNCNNFSVEEYHRRVKSILNNALTQYFEAQKQIIIMKANSKITNMYTIFKDKKHLLEDLKLPCGYPISSLIDEDFDISSNIHRLYYIHTFAIEYIHTIECSHEYGERDFIELIQYFNIVDKLQSMDLTIYQSYLYECDYKINIYTYWKQFFPDVQLFQHAIVLVAHKIHYDNLNRDNSNSDGISFILSSFLDGSFDLSSTKLDNVSDDSGSNNASDNVSDDNASDNVSEDNANENSYSEDSDK